MTVLRIFVEGDCRTCKRALTLAAEVHTRFPAMEVEVLNLSDPAVVPPDAVIAVPAYVLDGQLLSLGNPERTALMRKLTARLEGQED